MQVFFCHVYPWADLAALGNARALLSSCASKVYVPNFSLQSCMDTFS